MTFDFKVGQTVRLRNKGRAKIVGYSKDLKAFKVKHYEDVADSTYTYWNDGTFGFTKSDYDIVEIIGGGQND